VSSTTFHARWTADRSPAGPPPRCAAARCALHEDQPRCPASAAVVAVPADDPGFARDRIARRELPERLLAQLDRGNASACHVLVTPQDRRLLADLAVHERNQGMVDHRRDARRSGSATQSCRLRSGAGGFGSRPVVLDRQLRAVRDSRRANPPWRRGTRSPQGRARRPRRDRRRPAAALRGRVLEGERPERARFRAALDALAVYFGAAGRVGSSGHFWIDSQISRGTGSAPR
jgi:hypothetical protein